MSFFGQLLKGEKEEHAEAPIYLMPEFVVQDPHGARIFIDGEVTTQEQQSTIHVWKADSDRDHMKIAKLTFCEGTSSAPSNEKGVAVELPNGMPIAFLNTQYAVAPPSPGARTAFSSNRHIAIYDTLTTGELNLRYPFAKVEREARGFTVRLAYGDMRVLCIVQSGGYNTDFGNVTDQNGKLIATVSNRGHSMTGLGLVRGAWNQDRRVVQVAEGEDLLLVVLAIVCATKLA